MQLWALLETVTAWKSEETLMQLPTGSHPAGEQLWHQENLAQRLSAQSQLRKSIRLERWNIWKRKLLVQLQLYALHV